MARCVTPDVGHPIESPLDSLGELGNGRSQERAKAEPSLSFRKRLPKEFFPAGESIHIENSQKNCLNQGTFVVLKDPCFEGIICLMAGADKHLMAWVAADKTRTNRVAKEELVQRSGGQGQFKPLHV
jgi:hypothetical protein